MAEGRLVSQDGFRWPLFISFSALADRFGAPAMFWAQKCVMGRERLATVVTGGCGSPRKEQLSWGDQRTAEMLEGAVQRRAR